MDQDFKVVTVSQPDDPSTLPVNEVSIVIGGMTRGACAAGIERRLNGLEGVKARVNFASERAKVAHTTAVPVRECPGDPVCRVYSRARPRAPRRD